jgi:peptide/nickel transport system substrate-binding protein
MRIPALTAIILTALFSGVFVNATSALSTLPLSDLSSPPQAPEYLLDDEAYDKMRSMADKQSDTSDAMSISNVNHREILHQMEFISGTTKEPGQSVWIFLVNDHQEIFTIGNTVSNGQREFTILASSLPKTIRGEVHLIASLVSDLRLSLNLPESISIVPFYFDREPPEQSSFDQPLSILIKKTEFLESSHPVKTLQSRYLEVYKKQNSEPLVLKISGQIYGKNLENIQLYSIQLPSMAQSRHNFDGLKSPEFSLEMTLQELKENEDTQIIFIASEAKDNILDSSEIPSTHQVISFRIKSADEFPNPFNIFWNANKNLMTLLLLGVLLISLIVIVKTFSSQSHWAKTLSILILLAEGILITYCLLVTTLTALFHQGLITIPGQEQTILSESGEAVSSPTLTRLDENLEIVPALSTSWSNISPHIWEFVLRKNVSAESIIRQLRVKTQTGSSDRTYVASLKNIVGVNPNKLQLITQYPDPLLPQKLTKVGFDLDSKESSSGQSYVPLEEFSNSSRLMKNQEYFDLPFIKSASEYKTILKVANEESIKELITKQQIDFFDEPETRLWPTLLQNNYRILPKINTESLMMLLDKKNVFLQEPTIVKALQKILRSPRILQTSYFQYGQIANQFVPPGVVGYDPELQLPEDPREIPEILETAKKNLGRTEIILTFQYPSNERTLGQTIQRELEIAGIRTITTEVPSGSYEKNLLEKSSDLTLLPIDFDLGDAAPFLDALIDSSSPYNKSYSNAQANELVQQSRIELNHSKRLELLQKIMKIIVIDDPAGIPMLFKKSFVAEKKPSAISWWERWLQKEILGWNK